MKDKLKKALSSCLCIALLFMNACGPKKPVTVTNLPPGVSQQAVQNWLTATQKLDEAVSITHTVKQSIIAARDAGGFPDNVAYGKALRLVGKALQVEGAGADALKKQPNAWSTSVTTQVSGYVNEALTALTDLTTTGAVGIKNPSTQQQVLALIGNSATILRLILSLAVQPVALLNEFQPPSINLIFRGENFFEHKLVTA